MTNVRHYHSIESVGRQEGGGGWEEEEEEEGGRVRGREFAQASQTSEEFPRIFPSQWKVAIVSPPHPPHSPSLPLPNPLLPGIRPIQSGILGRS